jgi:oxygen-dependent protoporphyrinogen oxidase
MPADRLGAVESRAAEPAAADGTASPAAGAAAVTAAVIGGGVSGLVAARELALAGMQVVLLEADDRLGGRVRSETIAGATIDIGAEAFATRGGGVAELLAELGLGGEIVSPAPLGSWVVAGSGAVPLPAAGTIGIPATPLSRDAVRALGRAGALRAAAEPLLPRAVGRGGSLADLVEARLGRRVLERLVRPVVLGVYSTDPADMTIGSVAGLEAAFERRGSLVAAARDLRGSRTAAGGAVAGLRAGMGALIEALAAELDRLGVTVRTGTAVGALQSRADCEGWTVTEAEPGTAVDVDAVILAVPETVARRLLHAPPSAPEGRVEVIALLVDDTRLDPAPRGTGVLVAADAAPRITAKALTHVTAKWPARATALDAGRHVLRLSYGRVGSAPATEALSDEEATRLAIRDASQILGVELRADSIRGMRRRAWIAGSSTTGADSPLPEPSGAAFAGDWVSGTGLASVIPGARAAARRIMEVALRDDRAMETGTPETNRTASHHEGAQQR